MVNAAPGRENTSAEGLFRVGDLTKETTFTALSSEAHNALQRRDVYRLEATFEGRRKADCGHQASYIF